MLILLLNLRKYILKINKKINLIINESSCLLEKKIERERERERVHILTTILDKGIPRLPKKHPKANLNDA